MKPITASIGQVAYKTIIKSETHELIADEPEALGGGGQGFSPSELLASSLAACTAITLRMYANRNQWEVENIEVNVSLSFDQSDNSTKMNREIILTGNLDEGQKTRMLNVANKCPMHKTLSGSIVIDSTLSQIF